MQLNVLAAGVAPVTPGWGSDVVVTAEDAVVVVASAVLVDVGEIDEVLETIFSGVVSTVDVVVLFKTLGASVITTVVVVLGEL